MNLDNPAVLVWMCETVLREAITEKELCAWLDAQTLLQLWDDLFVPRGERAAWEQPIRAKEEVDALRAAFADRPRG